jgi:L-asparaginase
VRAAPIVRAVAVVLAVAGAAAEPPRAAVHAEPAQPAASLPRVRVIATGGTISNRAGGRFTGADLLKSIPAVDRYVRAEAEQFSNVGSASLTLVQWRDLARRINDLFREDADLAGIVVTSGTDTLEEIAYFLNLTVRHDRPIVMVGSMRDPNTVGYEGPANLLAGLRVAAEPTARGKGVLVVLNDQINAAREVTKTDAHRLDTFSSRDYGQLGVVDADRVVFYRTPLKRHTAASEFDIAQIAALPRVDIVMVYQGASGDLIRALVDLGAKGIVIAGVGAGGTSGTQNAGLRYATGKGAVVVMSTRTGSGRIPARQANGTQSGGSFTSVNAEDLAPVKARILLMLALATTTDSAVIQRMFTEY